MNTIAARQLLQSQLFPGGIPALWCPTLTHFQSANVPDSARAGAHLRSLAPHVGGILVPGSTGEGWEMSDAHIRTVLEVYLTVAREHGLHVLIGILKTDTDSVIACLQTMRDYLAHPAVAGITVCPPKGPELTQTQILGALRRVLCLGIPTALYQLPQVTENEMAPQTVATLALEFPNFILFKDTSGHDRAALSGQDFGGVFLVRGAEQGGYARWPKASGGPYDGFLLSTANVFARELQKILGYAKQGRNTEASALSAKLEALVMEAFALARQIPAGNPFANANKLLDHFRAHGPRAMDTPPPLLYSGVRLPWESLRQTYDLLVRHQMLPTQGYLT